MGRGREEEEEEEEEEGLEKERGSRPGQSFPLVT